MKILFLSRWFPSPMNNGSKIRIYNLLRGLSQHHDVTLLSFADQPGMSPEAPEIRAVCSKVQVVPWREFDPTTAAPGWASSASNRAPLWTLSRPKWRGRSRRH